MTDSELNAAREQQAERILELARHICRTMMTHNPPLTYRMLTSLTESSQYIHAILRQSALLAGTSPVGPRSGTDGDAKPFPDQPVSTLLQAKPSPTPLTITVGTGTP